jgi:DNA helicase HerA-like ATPase
MNQWSGNQARPLGMVVSGSLSKGVEVKLDSDTSVEAIKAGTFVTIQGAQYRYFGLVTDVTLQALDQRMQISPPDVSNPLIAQVMQGTGFFGVMSVRPEVTITGDATSMFEGPQPAKSVPSHFSRVFTASEQDIGLVFGEEDEKHFHIGTPLDMETKVCLDLEAFSQRSNGIFGKSGTGKSFLTRLILMGLIQSGVASTLVFDMHGEYGWEARDPERGRTVKGLKQLFPSSVAVFSLDEENARRRNLSPDHIVRIGYNEIEPEDIELLAGTLNLTAIQTQVVPQIARRFDRNWLRRFLDLDHAGLAELAKELNAHEGTLGALHRKLVTLERMQFLTRSDSGGQEAMRKVLEYLDRGMHVVLEFGRYGSDITAYVLVANLLSRRIHNMYVRRTEEFMGQNGKMPQPLVIVIEEAHRFLNPGIAEQTIFGNIAREMRKYNVTLLVVDQRPSGIDDEVMSQIGTKICCLLDNERDVDAVLNGVSGGRELRHVLARLESKQQALIFGHALPLPLVVQTREYGSADSYAQLQGFSHQRDMAQALEQDADDLFGGR